MAFSHRLISYQELSLQLDEFSENDLRSMMPSYFESSYSHSQGSEFALTDSSNSLIKKIEHVKKLERQPKSKVLFKEIAERGRAIIAMSVGGAGIGGAVGGLPGAIFGLFLAGIFACVTRCSAV